MDEVNLKPVGCKKHILTASGRRFWPLEPRVEDVAIEDIAHALSNQCRFSGHVRKFYSVAEHCVRVAMEVMWRCGDPVRSAGGLVHDAAEAYLVDLPTPVKRQVVGYAEMETACARVIESALGLPRGIAEDRIVQTCDAILLATEVRDLMPPDEAWATLPQAPLSGIIVPWSPEEARVSFMNLARFLGLVRS